MRSLCNEGLQNSICLQHENQTSYQFGNTHAQTRRTEKEGLLVSLQMLATPHTAFELKANSYPTASQLDIDDVIDILRSARKTKNIIRARHLHAHICDHGLENHHVLTGVVIRMFVACGGVAEAQRIFNQSMHCNEHAWTSLMEGYADFGHCELVLKLFEGMQDHGVLPSVFTFGAIVKAITRSTNVTRGQEIHAEIIVKGYDRDSLLGNGLVGLYAKCGAMLEACTVLRMLPRKDSVSWNALIMGLAEHGFTMQAFQCLEQMECEGLCPDDVTFILSLKASVSTRSIEIGREIHTEIVKRGMENKRFIASTLVDLYAKSGALSEAEIMFEKIEDKDVVAWNTLIAGYADKKMDEDLLSSAREMQLAGICPDATTFVSFLKASESINIVFQIHNEITGKGFDRDDFVGSTLVCVYAKCEALAEACKVFDALRVQDVVAWTALVSSFSASDLNWDLLDCLEHMRLSCVCPSPAIFACMLKTFACLGSLDRGKALHCELISKGFELDSITGCSLVDFYVKCGLLAEAEAVFNRLATLDIATWTAMMMGYIDHGFNIQALKCWEQMESTGALPDCIVFACALKACGNLEALDQGQRLHSYATKVGLDKGDVVGNALVDMYLKCGLFAEGLCVFHKFSPQAGLAWNTLSAGFADQGLLEEALETFHLMQLNGVLTDVTAWNSLISGYASEEHEEDVFKLFAQMQEQGVVPSMVLHLTMMKVCSNTLHLEMSKKLHAQLSNLYELRRMETSLASVMIDMYGKCGDMQHARVVFDLSVSKELGAWDALLQGYACLGQGKNVFELFERMRSSGVLPDEILFLSLLNVCTHTGSVDDGQKQFEVMEKEFGIIPSIKHYTCMVDLFGRSGQLDEALMIIQKMSSELNFVLWCTFLDACQKYGDVYLWKMAFESAAIMDASPFFSARKLFMDVRG